MRNAASAHRYTAILALVALTLLVLQPACERLARHWSDAPPPAASLLHYPGAPCCDALEARSHEAGTAAAASVAKGASFAFVPISAVLAVLPLAFLAPAAPPGAAALPPRSYYARSARILR